MIISIKEQHLQTGNMAFSVPAPVTDATVCPLQGKHTALLCSWQTAQSVFLPATLNTSTHVSDCLKGRTEHDLQVSVLPAYQ